MIRFIRRSLVAIAVAFILVTVAVKVNDAPAEPSPVEQRLAKFIDAYNNGDAQTMCEMLDARYWVQYWGLVSPGQCLEAFKTGPNDTPLRYRILSTTHLDGNTAVVIVEVMDEPTYQACNHDENYAGKKLSEAEAACEAGKGYMLFTLELSRRLPSSEYRSDAYAPKKKPEGERVLRYAQWQVISTAAV